MNINWNAPINSLGYGVAGLNILKGLVELGHYPALFPLSTEVQNQDDIPILQKCVELASQYDVNAPCVRLWHQFDLAQTIGKGQHIGFPIFELDKFTNIEKHHLSNLDKIFVCSQWAKEIIELNQINTPTYVVPLGVDRSIFHENIQINQQIYESLKLTNEYVFLHIGKWEIRKGADIIVDAFNNAFTKMDNVRLIMACYNPFIGEENKQWETLYKSSELGEKITILPRLQTQKDVAVLMQIAECGLFPARAEGWNLELLEMLSMGKDVICTNFSAHKEFVSKENAHLIEVEAVEAAHDGKWFHGQGNWAKLEKNQIDQLIEHMRSLYKGSNEELNEEKLNSAGIETAKKFSWKNSANAVIDGILA